MFVTATLTPRLPSRVVRKTDRLLLQQVGLTTNLETGQMLAPAGINLADNTVVVVTNPQRALLQLEKDYPGRNKPEWVAHLDNELRIHVAGFGDEPFQGYFIEGRGIVFRVLETISERWANCDTPNGRGNLVLSLHYEDARSVRTISLVFRPGQTTQVLDPFGTAPKTTEAISQMAAKAAEPFRVQPAEVVH